MPLPDGRTVLATGCRDGTIQLWDPETSQPTEPPLGGHIYGVQALATVLLPDGHELLASGA